MSKLQIIVSSYNRPKGLLSALMSVCHQTFADWECYVCDDGSTNPNVNVVLESFAEDRRFRILRGPYVSPKLKAEQFLTMGNLINEALRQGDSQYVSYLGDGVEYRPQRCRLMIDYLDSRSHVDAVWGQQDVVKLDHEGNTISERMSRPSGSPPEKWCGPIFVSRLEQGNFLDHNSVIERRNDIPWSSDPQHWTNLDWQRWKEMARRLKTFHFLPYVVGETKFSWPNNIGEMVAQGQSIQDVVEAR